MKKSKIILITNQKGGVGKSTLAFNLANNIKKDCKVAILDLDVQGSLTQIASLNPSLEIITYQDKIENIKSLKYDFIFIDTPPYLLDKIDELYRLSDIIIIPTKASAFDLFAMQNMIEKIKELSLESKTMILFNMMKHNTLLNQDIHDQVKEFGIEIANTKISDLVSFSKSVLLQGLEDHQKAQKQIDSLTKEILIKLV